MYVQSTCFLVIFTILYTVHLARLGPRRGLPPPATIRRVDSAAVFVYNWGLIGVRPVAKQERDMQVTSIIRVPQEAEEVFARARDEAHRVFAAEKEAAQTELRTAPMCKKGDKLLVQWLNRDPEFDINDAVKVLAPAAKAEYHRIADAAEAECDRVMDAAEAECDRIADAAEAEYGRIAGAAWAKLYIAQEHPDV